MLRIIDETIKARWRAQGSDRTLYLVDGAPSHMHSSVARSLDRLNFSLYISPPNSTPFCQACNQGGSDPICTPLSLINPRSTKCLTKACKMLMLLG